MATAAIKIDGVLGSDTDLELGDTITFSNNDDTGVSTWAWTILDKPAASTATLTTPAAATTDLTLDVEGTFLVELDVNSGGDTDTVVAAVQSLRSRIRWPAAGEVLEGDATRGWAVAREAALIKQNELISAGAIQVGIIPVNEIAPDSVSWKRGNVVAASTVSDIDPSGSGVETVPIWRKPYMVVNGGDIPALIGIVVNDIDGNDSFDQSVDNVPGIAGRVVNVCVKGFVKGISGALDFTDATIFPEGANGGDPLWCDTITAAHELTNINDYWGTSTVQGGSVGDFDAFDDNSLFVGYVVDDGDPGSVYVTSPTHHEYRTAIHRVDNGIACHSLRLGLATSQEGNYDGIKPYAVDAGAIQVETYDINHGAAATMAQYDIVSLRATDTTDGDARTGMLSAHLADLADDTTWSYLGMITDVGNAPNSGRNIMVTTFGVVTGCSSAFPGGATDGEVLYVSTTDGELTRLSSLSDTDPKVAVGRIISTTLESGIFFVGPDSNLATTSRVQWEDAGSFLYPSNPTSYQVVIGESTQQGAGQYVLEVQGAVFVEADDDSNFLGVQPSAGSSTTGRSYTITAGKGANGTGGTAPAAGGAFTFTGGAGGDSAALADTGAAGADCVVSGGTGGTGGSTAAAGGVGGVLQVKGGTGGVGGSGDGDGGNGQVLQLFGGTGGDGGVTNSDGGDGGGVNMQGGAAGSGQGTGSNGALGAITIGATNTSLVTIGDDLGAPVTIGGDLTTGTNVARFISTQTTAISANAGNVEMVLCTAGGITITLTTAATVAGRVLTVLDQGGNAGSSTITIDTQGSELINGAATETITTNYGFRKLFSDGTDWFVIGTN